MSPGRYGSEALPVADRTGLRIARAACREKDVLGLDREIPRHDAEPRPSAARDALDRRHRAVRDERHLLVAQQVAERVNYRGGFLVCGEDPSVGHSLRPHAERLEPAADLPRRAFAHRLRDELGAPRGDSAARNVIQELLGRDVLREVAAAVRGHQHLRAETRLALDEDARNAALRGDRRREHPRCATADDDEFRGPCRLALVVAVHG